MTLLLACSDYVFDLRDDKPPGDTGAPDTAGDSGAESTAETDGLPDTAESAETSTEGGCEDAWPDRAVSAEGCDPGADWTLVERWQWTDPDQSSTSVHALRPADSDGDGVVTAADAMALWAWSASPASAGHHASLLDATGLLVRVEEHHLAAWTSTPRPADVDLTRAGMELGALDSFPDGTARWTVADEAAITVDAAVEADDHALPWIVDLDGDGAAEALVGASVLDAATGAALGRLHQGEDTPNVLAADLDADGDAEIVGVTVGGHLGVWHAVDAAPVACDVAGGGLLPDTYPTFAVADLDGDAEGEIVVTAAGVFAVCDPDGTRIAAVAADWAAGPVVAVGELDGDAGPEIVTSLHPSGKRWGVGAFDADLSERWFADATEPMQSPLHLADLDGDGLHEILIREHDLLLIRDGEGALLASAATGYSTNHWRNVPLVVDLDGDTLAEIVLAGLDPSVQVFESPSGGWSVPGSEVPTPGVGHHPGVLGVDGTPPVPAAWWADPTNNAWQAHPTGGAPLPELSVSVASLCIETCDQDYVLTAYVSNTGRGDTRVEVEVEAVVDGVAVASAAIPPPLPVGVARAVTLRVPTSAANLEVRVDGADAVDECGTAVHVVVVDDLPCD